ncbi:hypothetical protein thsrh120_34180 [Rhizobium sp. No.120]
MVRLVGGRRLEVAEQTQITCLYHKAQLFEELSDKGGLRRFLRLDLAPRLHKGNRAALAHKQRFSIRAKYQGGCYSYRFRHVVI